MLAYQLQATNSHYLQLPVNQPKTPVHSYNKDGAMRYSNPGDPVYAPNSFGGPAADPELWKGDSHHVAREIIRSAYTLHSQDDDVGQPRAVGEGHDRHRPRPPCQQHRRARQRA